MTNLTNQVALISGGGSGIGRAIAQVLARQGVKVAICGRRSEPLAAVEQSISAQGGQVLGVQADVSQADDVTRLVQTVVDTFGPIDVLVNNAGIGGGGFIHEHDLEAWDRILAVNLRGSFLLARAVLPSMRQRRRGQIINISSETGLEHYPGDGAYGVSKHALNALSEYIQRENQELGIRVNTICPGMVVTEMTQGNPSLNEAKCLQPEEIAELVLWLLSRQPNLKIGRPVLIQTMENPWQ